MNFQEKIELASESKLTFIGRLIVLLLIFLPFEISLFYGNSFMMSIVWEVAGFMLLFFALFVLITILITFSWLIFGDGDYVVKYYIFPIFKNIIIGFKLLFGDYKTKNEL